MNEKIIEILKQYKFEHISEKQAVNEILGLFSFIERLNSIPKYEVTDFRDYSDCWLEEDLTYDEPENAKYI